MDSWLVNLFYIFRLSLKFTIFIKRHLVVRELCWVSDSEALLGSLSAQEKLP